MARKLQLIDLYEEYVMDILPVWVPLVLGPKYGQKQTEEKGYNS